MEINEIFSVIYDFGRSEKENFVMNRHTRIPGLWRQELDAGLWTLDAVNWKLDSGH